METFGVMGISGTQSPDAFLRKQTFSRIQLDLNGIQLDIILLTHFIYLLALI